MMKKRFVPQASAVLACCLLAAGAQAQSARFSGDTFPKGQFDGRHEVDEVVTIGHLGEGSLVIDQGAVFNNMGRRTSIAEGPGSTAHITVTNGGIWNNYLMWIGRRGDAYINVINGGKINADLAQIGQLQGGSATAIVDGPGSAWDNHLIHLGVNHGNGKIIVRNGGTVSSEEGIYAGLDVASVGDIEIDGPQSTVTTRRRCALGMSGESTVKITNGGALNCSIGWNPRSGLDGTDINWGHVLLTGAGSKWNVGSNLYVGSSHSAGVGIHLGRATLDIGEGSTVQVHTSLNLGRDEPHTRGGAGTLNISGSGSPGTVIAERITMGYDGRNNINFNHTDTSGNYRFAPSISGGNYSAVNVMGSGTTVLTGNNTYAAHTSIRAGVLRAGSATALSETSTYGISASGTLDTNGYSVKLGPVTNTGTFTMGTGNTRAETTVNNYLGLEGTIRMNAALAGNASPTQKLLVGGDTSGTSTLHITNVGGAGGQTTGNGILLIQVGLESNAEFRLAAPGYVDAGGFRYTLVKVARNWYLQSQPVGAKAAKSAAADDGAACLPALAATAGAAPAAASRCAAPAAASTLAAAQPASAAARASAATAEGAAALDAAARDATAAMDGEKNGDAMRLASAVPVPSLGIVGMVSLSALVGIAGMRRSRIAA